MSKTGQAKQIIENCRGDAFGGWPARTLLEAGYIRWWKSCVPSRKQGRAVISSF